MAGIDIQTAAIKALAANGGQDGFQGKGEGRGIKPQRCLSNVIDHIRHFKGFKGYDTGGFALGIDCVDPHTVFMIRSLRVKCWIERGMVRSVAAHCGEFLNVVPDFDNVVGVFEAGQQSICCFSHNSLRLARAVGS